MPRELRSCRRVAVPMSLSRLSSFVFVTFLLCASNAVASSQPLNTLHSFCSQPSCADGDNPNPTLVQGPDGNLYGTTFAGGGPQNAGVLFRVTPEGTFAVLHTFCSLTGCADGSRPMAGLVLDTDGSFYGTTGAGGASNDGTLFRLSATGVFSTVYSFCSQPNCSDGSFPKQMIRGADGNFYGVTTGGGNHNSYCPNECGTIFRLTPSGQLTTIYRFCTQQRCPDGAFPQTLIQGTDGALYGTTTFDDGTAFRVSPSGTLQTLYSFCQLPGCTDGLGPNALVEAVDGKFYGTTGAGGATGYCIAQCGTIFDITPSGSFLSIYDFCNQPGCLDGSNPNSMVQAPDGNFYGTTGGGGIDDEYGVVFKFSPSGTMDHAVPVLFAGELCGRRSSPIVDASHRWQFLRSDVQRRRQRLRRHDFQTHPSRHSGDAIRAGGGLPVSRHTPNTQSHTGRYVGKASWFRSWAIATFQPARPPTR